MTVREIIDYVQEQINSRRYWNDTRLINLMNILQLKMANDLKLVFRDFYKFSSTTEQRYQMPSNLISLEYLWYDNNGTESQIDIVSSPREVYGKHSDPDTDTSDQPYKAFLWDSSGRLELWIYPIFNVAGVDIWMWFFGIPPKLTTENDMPVLPNEWHIHLVDAIINRTMQIDEQITKGEELALWKDIILTCKQMETTRSIMERRASVQQDRLYPDPDYRGRGMGSGLIDGSEQGITW